MTKLPPQLMNAVEEYATACCDFVTGVRMETMMPKKAVLEKAIAQYGAACAAAERELVEVLRANLAETIEEWAESEKAAVAAEREACARVVESTYVRYDYAIANGIAAAIRARAI